MPQAPHITVEGEPLLDTLIRALTEGIGGAGVLSTGDLEVTAGSDDLEIDVASGDVVLDGSTTSFDGESPAATLSEGDSDDDRWDTIAFDTSDKDITVHEGTPAEYPTAPDLEDDEIALALVYVESDATNVDDGDILDIRTLARQSDDSYYADSTDSYSVDTVAAALDELQEAAQIGSYPLENSDLDNSTVDVAGNSVELGDSTDVDLADLDSKPHSDLDDAPADAHHTRFSEDSDDALSDIPNRDHSDLEGVEADQHHDEDHASRHEEGGDDELDHNSLALNEDDHHTPPATDSDTQSGDGSEDTFTISHSLGETPSAAHVQPTSEDAAGEFWVSDKTDADVEITYSSAPADGTDNLSWDIITVA